MNQQQAQTVQVIQKNEGCLSGCGTLLAVLFVLGLLVTYWYVAIPVAVVLGGVGLWYWNERKNQLPAPQPGEADPWLNRIALRLSSQGYAEQTRNTGPALEGIPLQGDLVLEGNGLQMFVNVFADDYAAGHAASKLRAKPEVQQAMTVGQSAVLSEGRTVLVAKPLGGPIDPTRIESVISMVANVSPKDASEIRSPELPPPSPELPTQADALEQLQRLGDLRDKNIITEDEFNAKKAELLKRL